MKVIFLLTSITLGVSIAACSQSPKESKQDERVIKNRELMKDYFLCSCIIQGFHRDSVFLEDHTRSVLVEMMEYDYENKLKIDDAVKRVVDEISVSNYTNKKGVFSTCIDFYKSNELDQLVKSFKLRN